MSFLFLFWHRNPSNYVIRLGDHNRHRNEGTEQNIGASRVIKHPQYDSRRINNDIALLKLSRAANINDRVLPACLPRANYIEQRVTLQVSLVCSQIERSHRGH